METKNLTIMFTDIKGFTSRTSKSSRKEVVELLEKHDKLIRPVFKEFGGSVVKTMGDAFLVTFSSPTDAVLCGMKIQDILKKYNEESEDENLEVRVAINSGEVHIKEGDIYGEPVNIAARIEGLANANEIWFTDAVYLAMNKSEIPSSEVGMRQLKGIPHAVKVYKVLDESNVSSRFFSKNKTPKDRSTFLSRKWNFFLFRKPYIYVLALFLFLLFISAVSDKEEKDIEPKDMRVDEKFISADSRDAEELISRYEELDRVSSETAISAAKAYFELGEDEKGVDAILTAADKDPSYDEWVQIMEIARQQLSENNPNQEITKELDRKIIEGLHNDVIPGDFFDMIQNEWITDENRVLRANSFIILSQLDRTEPQALADYLAVEMDKSNDKLKPLEFAENVIRDDGKKDEVFGILKETLEGENLDVLIEFLGER